MLRVSIILALLLGLLGQDSPFSRRKVTKEPKKEKVTKEEPKPEIKGESSEGPAEDAPPELPPLDTGTRSQLNTLVRNYWDNPSDEILSQISALEVQYKIQKKDIDSILKTMQGLVRKGSTIQRNGRHRYSHPEHSAEYIVDASQAGSRNALWISLHGGGQGMGDPARTAPRVGGVPGPNVKVYPAVKQKTGNAWASEREETWVLELIEGIKRTFDIDTNRIYLVGHSMGGFGTWSIGTNHADLFAGMGPMAGGLPRQANLPNLLHVPIYFFHSTDDRQVKPDWDQKSAARLKELKDQYGPFDYVYKEYNNIGHGRPGHAMAPLYKFIGTRRRNPYPKHILWSPYRPYKKLFYWLKLNAPGRGTIEAKIEKDNTIAITGSVDEVFINEKMGIKLSKEVVVTMGGSEVYRGMVDYSIAALVESYEAKRDPQMYFYAKIRLR